MNKIKLPEQTFVDKAIAWISPQAGLRRWQARTQMAMLGGYTGASKSRRQTQTWNPLKGSGDNVTLDDLPVLRDRSRDLLRNAPLAVGAVSTVVTNVIGTGLKPQAHVDRNVLRPYLKTDDQSVFYQKFLFRSCLDLYNLEVLKDDEGGRHAQ